MPNLSGYPVRSSVSTTDRLPICTAGSDQLNGATVAQILAAGGGSSVTVPDSAPLLGSTSAGALEAVTVGSGLSLTGGVLSASGAAAGSITYTETNPGPITLCSTNDGYNVTALCLAPPTSGNWSFDLLVEALPFGSGPGLHIEDADGRGFIAYFYQGNSWLGQYTTARNNYVQQPISYSPVTTPQTLWFRVTFDATAQAITILVSANRIVWSLFGEPLLLSGGSIGVPVLLGMGCINLGAFGAQMHLWHFALSDTA